MTAILHPKAPPSDRDKRHQVTVDKFGFPLIAYFLGGATK